MGRYSLIPQLTTHFCRSPRQPMSPRTPTTGVPRTRDPSGLGSNPLRSPRPDSSRPDLSSLPQQSNDKYAFQPFLHLFLALPALLVTHAFLWDASLRMSEFMPRLHLTRAVPRSLIHRSIASPGARVMLPCRRRARLAARRLSVRAWL